MCSLALKYLTGTGVEPDFDQAFQLLNASAEKLNKGKKVFFLHIFFHTFFIRCNF